MKNPNKKNKKCVVCGGRLTGGRRKFCSIVCEKIFRKEYRKEYDKRNEEKNKKYRKQYREQNKEERKEYNKKYYEEHKEERKEYTKKWKERNKEKVKEQSKRYVEQNKEEKKEYNKKYRKNNKGKVKEWSKRYRDKNKEKINERQRQHRKQNIEKARKKGKVYYRKNKDYYKGYRKLHRKEINERAKKRRQNPIHKLHGNISSSMRQFLKSKNLSKNGRKTETLIINTFQEIKKHLEKNFLPGMSWKNMGRNGWHIDHIISVKFFKFTSTDDVEFKYCWSIENLQPLWEKDNIRKGDKVMLWGKEYNAKYLERDYFSKITY